MVKDSKIINVDPDIEFAVSKAKNIYNSGGIFIYPTDTIYGFGCNPFESSAIKRLNDIKGRSKQKQYILLADSVDTIKNYIELNDKKIIQRLENIWPNPVSIIFTLNDETKKTLNRNSVAFRIPANDFCLRLLKEIKNPLVSTSVNRSNQTPLTEISSIKNEFADKVDAVFYTVNKERSGASTLVDLTGKDPKILREGKINFIEKWLNFD
jgi:L-threonylcarbamoyladenylate synthase